MQIRNSFEVALPPAEAWVVLTDVERIAPCMPGAELVEVIDERTYKGKVSVRLGPVALTFNGTARFEEKDAAARIARVKAQGTDLRGRGGAVANVQFALEPTDRGTAVQIRTDLQLSGSVAQYGRGAGMISELASHLIQQFADCLHAQLAEARPVLEAAAETAPRPAKAPPAKPVPVLGLGLRVLWSAIVRRVRRLFAKG